MKTQDPGCLEASLASIKSETDNLPDISVLFKALGDDTRSKIAFALSKSELCVHDLAVILDMSPQAISYHLRLLRALRLVKYRKLGRHVMYSLDDHHVSNMLQQAVAHSSHT